MAKYDKTIKIGEFSAAVTDILKDYEGSVTDAVNDSAKESLEWAKKELNRTSPVGKGKRSGRYKKSWTIGQSGDSFTRKNAVYNKKDYQLTHLLANGHALRRGGRTIGSVGSKHDIDGINDQAQKRFEENLVRKVEEIK